jgi:hypothetical protein
MQMSLPVKSLRKGSYLKIKENYPNKLVNIVINNLIIILRNLKINMLKLQC